MANEILLKEEYGDTGNWGAVAEPLADIMTEHKLSLNQMLTGIHAFLMALQASGRAQLLKFWIGHSSGNDITARDDTTARYDKSCDDHEWRQTWANKCGIGFTLPEIVDAGHPAPKSSKVFEPVASSSPQPAAAPKVSEALQPQPTYIAEDNDLDLFFYSPVPEEAA
jgi:hypothetical protein